MASQFNKTSNFTPHQPDPFGVARRAGDVRRNLEAKRKVESAKKVPFADWAARLNTMADEAHDEDLLALETDLLDLRDEIRKHG
jgi:hypothetical protein